MIIIIYQQLKKMLSSMLMPNVVLFIMLVFFSKPIKIIITNFFANDLKVYDIWVVVGQYSREIHDVL